MSIAIEVVSCEVREVTGKNGPNAGKKFLIPEVTGYVKLPGEKYPTKVVFPVAKGAAQPPAGMYSLDIANSVYVDMNGRLQLRQSPALVPVSSKQQPA